MVYRLQPERPIQSRRRKAVHRRALPISGHILVRNIRLFWLVITNRFEMDLLVGEKRYCCSRRIIAAAAPWIAAENSVETTDASDEQTILLNGFEAVLRASWMVFAPCAQEWTNAALIETNAFDSQSLRDG
jgi:hypothetical protein